MKYLGLFVFLHSFFLVNSQTIKTNIINHTSEIRSTNPEDLDFSDLKIIGTSIADARIVFLGEQDHGDATTFEAKTRIIKYLHEQKGFNILAFESDFYNLNKKTDDKASIIDIESSILAIWSNCLQVNPLLKYIDQQKESPLLISGIDCAIGQMSDKDKINCLTAVTSYIKDKTTPLSTKNASKFNQILHDLLFFIKPTKNRKARFKKIKKSNQKFFFSTLSKIQDQIKPTDKNSFLLQTLINIDCYAKHAWGFKAGKYEDIRDQQMANNLLWLMNVKYPNEKIIVWAHNAHIIRKVFNKKGKRVFTKSMGEYIYNNLGKQLTYSIGFTSMKGATKRASLNKKHKEYQIRLPQKNSVENWIASKNYTNAFINFKDIPNQDIFFNMKGIWHLNMNTNWLNSYDGIFYIEEIFPCIKEKDF